MRKKLRYVRLSEGEEQELNRLAKNWGCDRCEVLRFSFRMLLLNVTGKELTLRKEKLN